jgi:hypothetical protein
MRIHFLIVGLVSLAASLAPAHSRGFAWFFSHSKPSGSCAGQSVVATYYTSGRRTASGKAFDPGGYTAAHRTLPFVPLHQCVFVSCHFSRSGFSSQFEAALNIGRQVNEAKLSPR